MSIHKVDNCHQAPTSSRSSSRHIEAPTANRSFWAAPEKRDLTGYQPHKLAQSLHPAASSGTIGPTHAQAQESEHSDFCPVTGDEPSKPLTGPKTISTLASSSGASARPNYQASEVIQSSNNAFANPEVIATGFDRRESPIPPPPLNINRLPKYAWNGNESTKKPLIGKATLDDSIGSLTASAAASKSQQPTDDLLNQETQSYKQCLVREETAHGVDESNVTQEAETKSKSSNAVSSEAKLAATAYIPPHLRIPDAEAREAKHSSIHEKDVNSNTRSADPWENLAAPVTPTVNQAETHLQHHVNESKSGMGARDGNTSGTEGNFDSSGSGSGSPDRNPGSSSASGVMISKTEIEHLPPHLQLPKPGASTELEETPTTAKSKTSFINEIPQIKSSAVQFAPAANSSSADNSHLPPHLRPPNLAMKESIVGHSHLPPHLRPAKLKNSTSEEGAPVKTPKEPNIESDNDKLHRIMASQPPLSFGKGKGKATNNNHIFATTGNGTTSGLSRGRMNKRKKLTKLEKMMLERGWSPPRVEKIRPQGDWLEKSDELWEERQPHVYDGQDMEAWVDHTLQETPSQPTFNDMSSPGFVMGTQMTVGDSLEATPTDDAFVTRRLADPFTKANAHKTASEAMEAFQEKMRRQKEAMPESPKTTKAERRDIRKAWRQREKEIDEMERNHPNKPRVDIFIRPAADYDLPQITKLHNTYIKNTGSALEVQALTTLQWRARLEDCRNSGYEMFVAIPKLEEMDEAQPNRRITSGEEIWGFCFADDLGGENHAYRFVAQIHVFVDMEHTRLGIGRCLLDRIMAATDINYYRKLFVMNMVFLNWRYFELSMLIRKTFRTRRSRMAWSVSSAATRDREDLHRNAFLQRGRK